MSKPTPFPNSILSQRAFAIDYRFGEEFFDRSGRISKRILENYPHFAWERVADTSCRFFDRPQNLSLTVTAGRIQFLQTALMEPDSMLAVGTFAGQAERMVSTVLGILDVHSFSRIGHQVTYLYPEVDSTSAQASLSRLSIMQVPNDLESLCGPTDELSRSFTFIRPDSLVRIALSGFEQAVILPEGLVHQALAIPHEQSANQHRKLMDKLKADRMLKQRPQFGFQVEMDSFVNEPKQLRIVDFVEQTDSDMNSLRPYILRKTT